MIPADQRLLEWRRAFDESFRTMPRPGTAHRRAFLLARAGERDVAIDAGSILTVLSPRPIAPVPRRGAPISLAGIAADDGLVVVVHWLSAFLGGGPQAVADPWIAVSRSVPGLGVGFDEVLRVIVVDPADVQPIAGDPALGEVVRAEGAIVRAVDLEPIVRGLAASS
jgi:chemotaxis signal transduction protein